MNSKKAEGKVISQNNECPQINILINGNKLKQRDQFKYLGPLISSEIESRIAQTKTSFQRIKSILTNNHISKKCYIELIFMFGCKA